MIRHNRKRRLALGVSVVLILTTAILLYSVGKESKPDEYGTDNPGVGPTMEEATIWEEKCGKYYPRDK